MSRAPAVLGVDAGGSAVRWQLRAADGPIDEGEVEAVSGLAFATPGGADRARAEARLDDLGRAVRRACEGRADLVAGVAGVTGLGAGDAAAEAVRARLAAELGLAEDRVRVVEDVRLAYRAAFAPGAGIVVHAGTGSIAVHEGGDGALLRAGGHGHLIDDAGGGHWIGRRALRTVLRVADRRGAPATGALATAVYDRLGATDWPAIRRWVYADPRSALASLVPAVGVALTRGDPDAGRIVGEAGGELAALATALQGRLSAPLPVAVSGGVARLGSPLLDAVRDGLEPPGEVRPVTERPVEAAARWAWVERDRG